MELPFADSGQNSTFVWILLVIGSFYVSHLVYNLYFHPLSSFPGPFLARASLLWRVKHSLGGRFHRVIQEQHAIYGPVIRVAPNELSFASSAAYRDIYGPWSGQTPFLKTGFYDIFGAGFKSRCIGSERDFKEHQRMKRALAPAFRTSALLTQEAVINKNIDAFLQQIRRHKAVSTGIDMTEWFEMLAFDILGEMAFGESFRCVEQGRSHYWQQTIAKHLFWINLIDNLRQFAILRKLARPILPFLNLPGNAHSEFSRTKIDRRLQVRTKDRPDFLSKIVQQVQDGDLSKEELTAHASTLVVAGGETVATLLSTVTFYLCRHPEVQLRLRNEIHGAFPTVQHINSQEAMKLPYLQACMTEGLRIYSPSALGLPRASPGASVSGFFVPRGAECYVSNYTITHDKTVFEHPYEFKPERWLRLVTDEMRDSNQPFSCGPRGCIGKSFANIEMSLALAKLVYVFDMETIDSELQWEESSRLYVQWSKPQLLVRFKLIEADRGE